MNENFDQLRHIPIDNCCCC